MGMVRHMKTTVDISDELLREARRMAHEEGVTLKSVIEEGLRAVLAQRGKRRDYILPDASMGGEGLQPEVRTASWSELRALAYGDRL
jgi:putative antitoxin of VapBC-like toxin-antitoxin system